MKLPKVLYASVEKGEEQWLNASADRQDLVDDTDPVNIGEYKLVSMGKWVRKLQPCKKEKK